MRWQAVLVACVMLAGAAGPAAAQYARIPYEQYAPVQYARGGEGVRPLDQILPGIRSSRPGTFYDAQGPFRGPDGRMHYRLKWMTPSGRIIWLDTDARSGRILGEERGPRRPVWEQQRTPQRRYVPRERSRRYAPMPRERRDYDRGRHLERDRPRFDRGRGAYGGYFGGSRERGSDRAGVRGYDRGRHEGRGHDRSRHR